MDASEIKFEGNGGTTFNSEEYCDSKTESSARLDHDIEEKSILEMDQICWTCLNTKNVNYMKDTCIGDANSLQLYEEIANIKIGSDSNESMQMMMICTNCSIKLGKVNSFIKMAQFHYTIMEEAANQIQKLNAQCDFNWVDYNVKKTAILRNALSNKKILDDTNILKIERDNGDQKGNKNEQDENVDCMSSIYYRSESSDDDIPLSEKLKILVNPTPETLKFNIKSRKRTRRKNISPKRKYVRKSKENLPDNNIDTENENASDIKEVLDLPDVCPLCLKQIRYLNKHLQSKHCLDWQNCICLKCEYHNKNTRELIEHCHTCSKNEELIELKSECNESICEKDFHDSDLDSDQREDFDYKPHMGSSMKRPSGKTSPCYFNYNCNKCENVAFDHYEGIEAHLKLVHSTESDCILCKTQFASHFSALYHIIVKHGRLKCCRLCLIGFKSAAELHAHYKSEEHNTKCAVCGEQFKNRKAVYEHRRKKHLNPQEENQKYKCPDCPKEFSNPHNINRHRAVAHNDLRFLCDTCGQSYTTKRNLRLHILKFHEGVPVQSKSTKKNFFCESCGRELRIFHKYAIALHRAKHKGHNFVCKKCYESFATEEEFKRHVEEMGHELFVCDKCPSQFVREENFKLHLKNHDAPGWNKNMFATWGKSAQLRNEKGEFVCCHCPKVFKDKQRLDNHIRVHTNERPYVCHICAKGFKTWIHRKTHLNIHLGIKKWTCKYCSKSFTNSSTLKGHEMIHTGERPHNCPECKKGFITISAMKKHRMTHFKTSDEKKNISLEKSDLKRDSEQESIAYKYDHIFAESNVSYEMVAPIKDTTVRILTVVKDC
ncbi:hypothetical protein HUJ04_001624 [Dendroctonus ponderosae]|uniref:C2H2-type domain-containing protein n=1 Tax=Dendroctonus ponderosae TaxID=77166 RepID=A0AAR5PQ69_DENPD|nr:hypothetical protein HUJ04_001624 [Dendroctonus ponderosae]KAH1009241.1 hypothetical protein HUJ04_001624 [Dendroctonus ponderosae]KAH1009242.1 hypothetical protein HUJ04_001624 [Dendroctonus ponderosae]KAH1009243.1 hypothetical protein HUJ04_001624 [Dendroctonus ponderosae]KAH1009244.1 hypothetical protein HUJ04_001624 [Dendroctonus ponderosae]